MAKRWWITMGLIAAVVAFVNMPSGDAQEKKANKRTASVSTLMKCCVQPNCAGAGKLANGTLDDKGFATVALQGQMLNEMGFALMDAGRCPSKEWAGAAKTLQECSSKLVEAAKAKDADGVKTAFKGLTAACAACHTAHKK